MIWNKIYLICLLFVSLISDKMTTLTEDTKLLKDPRQGWSRRNNICLAILFFTNLINYMDRYTVSAVLEDISKEVCQPDECSTEQQGFIQTAFVLVYLIVAPIFGYLGDRYSRKYIMAAGVLVWGGTSLSASFMTSYWPFLSLRALIAIGESAFTTIAPTVLGDLFTEDTRGLVLGIFYLAIPFGSGLGYVVGTTPENWHNGLRITPGLNFLAVILIIMFVVDPPRGVNEKEDRETSFLGDIWYLFKIKSFVLNVLGFTCVTHFTGALSWFGPTYVIHGLKSCQFQNGMLNSTTTAALSTASTTLSTATTTVNFLLGNSDDCDLRIDPDSVSFYFGVMLMMSGIIGVISGMFLSRWLRPKYPRIDPLICGVSLVISVPLVTYGVITAKDDLIVAFVFIFFGTTFLNMNWSISVDMSLYVVIPNRRSTAEAIHLMATHALGEAGAPYIIGTMSDAIIEDICPDLKCNDVELAKYLGLQRAMYLAFSLLFLGGVMYILATFWIKPDKEKVDRYLEGELEKYSENEHLRKRSFAGKIE